MAQLHGWPALLVHDPQLLQSSAGRFEKLKTRVIEATLAGTLLLTDDRDRTRLFWALGEEFVEFRTVDDVPGVVSDLLCGPSRLTRMAEASQVRARSLAHTNFSGGYETGLSRRGLSAIGFGYTAAGGAGD